MSKRTSLLVVFLGILGLQCSYAFKWVSLNPGDPVPLNAIRLDLNIKKYIGRTPYLNTIQLAEVYNSSYGIVVIYSKEVVIKEQFEVLVLEDNDKDCKWVYYDTDDIPESIVRGGTAWNREPIFVGKRQTSANSSGIASIYLTSDQIQFNPRDKEGDSYALACSEHHVWVNANSSKVPANSVKVDGANKRFVARLLGPLTFVPGNVRPEYNKTEAVFGNVEMISFHNQVLIEDTNKYTWKSNAKGNIPDYAVVCGKTKNNELMYIHRNLDVRYMLFSQALTNQYSYDILVRNT